MVIEDLESVEKIIQGWAPYLKIVQKMSDIYTKRSGKPSPERLVSNFALFFVMN